MKLIDIYRDVVSRLNQNGARDYNLSYNDVVNAINDAISQQRIQYVGEGRYQEFAETFSLFTTIEDFDYPFASSFTLPKPLIGEIPISTAIIAGNVEVADTPLKDEVASYSKNALVYRDGHVYTAIRDIENENTFNQIFDITDAVHYKAGNGLKYNEGAVIKDVEDKKFYRVDETFIASDGASPQLTELVWKLVYDLNKPVYFYEFHGIQQLRNFTLYDDDAYAYTVVGNKVYVAPKCQRFTITYIPKWIRVKDRNDEVNIPDFMVPNVKQQAIQLLGSKLGMAMAEAQNEE